MHYYLLMKKTYKYYHYRKNHYSHSPINNYSLEKLDSIEENCCIVLSFKKYVFSFITSIIIKCHIFFGDKNPELYLHPTSKIYAISLHSNCDICKYWITEFIEGYKNNIAKLSDILFSGKNPILLLFSPYLNRIILFSDIVNKIIINKNIVKKVMPKFGNIFISTRINNSYKYKYQELINIFKNKTENNWNNLTDKNCIIARCSFFMNFVNGNDIEFVKDIFPSDIYNKIISICTYIKYTSNNLVSKILNICEKELFNINDVKNENEINIENDKKNYSNDKENNIINISDDDGDDDPLIEEFNLSSESIKINDCEKLEGSLLEIDESELSQKKEIIDINKKNNDMLKKKRKGNQ